MSKADELVAEVEEKEKQFQQEVAEVVDNYQETVTRYCPLTIHMGEPSCCIKEHCAWFVRNGCAIFHLACAAIEWEKVLRSRGGNV